MKAVIFFACVAAAMAAVKRETPAQTGQNMLKEVEKHASEFQKTFTEQLNSLVNSKNTQDVNKALKEGSDSVLQQLSAFSATLQNALADANGKAKEALEQTRANIEKTAEDLRKSHPEVAQKANDLKTQFQQAVQNTVQETQKLAKEVQTNMEQTNQKLAPQLKEAYEDFVKNVEAVQKQLHEAATKQ